MQGTYPELPNELRHPGITQAKDDAPVEDDADNRPIFDDPIIGWWENAWSLRDPDPGPDEPLV